MSLVLWLAVAVVVWMMVLLWVAVVVVVWWLAAACRSSGCGVVGGSVAVDGSGVMDDASGVMDGSGVVEGIVIPCSGAAAGSRLWQQWQRCRHIHNTIVTTLMSDVPADGSLWRRLHCTEM